MHIQTEPISRCSRAKFLLPPGRNKLQHWEWRSWRSYKMLSNCREALWLWSPTIHGFTSFSSAQDRDSKMTSFLLCLGHLYLPFCVFKRNDLHLDSQLTFIPYHFPKFVNVSNTRQHILWSGGSWRIFNVRQVEWDGVCRCMHQCLRTSLKLPAKDWVIPLLGWSWFFHNHPHVFLFSCTKITICDSFHLSKIILSILKEL